MRRLPRRVWLLIAVGIALVFGTILLQLLTPASNATTPAARHDALRRAAGEPRALAVAGGGRVRRGARARIPLHRRRPRRALRHRAGGQGDLQTRTRRTSRASSSAAARSSSSPTAMTARTHLQRALDLSVVSGQFGHAARQPPPMARRSPARQSRRSPSIRGDRCARTPQADPRFLARATSENGTVVATMTRGKGRVQIVTGPYPLSNAGSAGGGQSRARPEPARGAACRGAHRLR